MTSGSRISGFRYDSVEQSLRASLIDPEGGWRHSERGRGGGERRGEYGEDKQRPRGCLVFSRHVLHSPRPRKRESRSQSPRNRFPMSVTSRGSSGPASGRSIALRGSVRVSARRGDLPRCRPAERVLAGAVLGAYLPRVQAAAARRAARAISGHRRSRESRKCPSRLLSRLRS